MGFYGSLLPLFHIRQGYQWRRAERRKQRGLLAFYGRLCRLDRVGQGNVSRAYSGGCNGWRL